MLSFFFQAEDGIRDYKVTGVQTCALPISSTSSSTSGASSCSGGRLGGARWPWPPCSGRVTRRRTFTGLEEIGRASCREGVWVAAVGGAFKKKREEGSADVKRRVAEQNSED